MDSYSAPIRRQTYLRSPTYLPYSYDFTNVLGTIREVSENMLQDRGSYYLPSGTHLFEHLRTGWVDVDPGACHWFIPLKESAGGELSLNGADERKDLVSLLNKHAEILSWLCSANDSALDGDDLIGYQFTPWAYDDFPPGIYACGFANNICVHEDYRDRGVQPIGFPNPVLTLIKSLKVAQKPRIGQFDEACEDTLSSVLKSITDLSKLTYPVGYPNQGSELKLFANPLEDTIPDIFDNVDPSSVIPKEAP